MRNTNFTKDIYQILQSDEKLLWTGKPQGGIKFRSIDFFLIPFSIVWCSFAIFWVILASKASIFFAMFGIPFVLVGLFLVFGRFIVDIKLRENTFYALTNNRIIINSGIFTKTTKSITLNTITTFELEEKSDGSGSILFEQTNPQFVRRKKVNLFSAIQSDNSLVFIENVRKVYQMMIENQKKN